jgi:transposase
LAKELIQRKHRVVLVEEACGFGYAFHRQLRQIGVEAHVVATEMLNRKRKTNRRDAAKLLDQLYDFDVNGHKKALRLIRVPTLEQQKKRRLCRMRSQLIKVRSIMEGQGRGLMLDFDFHEVPQGWWGARKWPKLRAKLLEHDPWLVEMLEHYQRLLIAQQRRITELERVIARESHYDPRQVAKGLGEITFVSLQREAMDWKRFGNRKAIGSYIGCCPCEFSSGPNQKLGSIDRMGNRRMRTLLVEAVWRLKKWNKSLARL